MATVGRNPCAGASAAILCAKASAEPATHFEIDRLPGRRQTDRPREKRPAVLRQTAELEQRGIFEEERALLGIIQREARQVDLTLVDLGRGEIGIHGQRRAQRRTGPIGQIERGRDSQRGIADQQTFALGQRQRRPQVETGALIDAAAVQRLVGV